MTTINESAERRAILELGQALQDAWNRGDAAGYASLFTDDADFVAWNGSRGRGRQAIEDAHRRLFDGPLAERVAWRAMWRAIVPRAQTAD